MVEAGAIDLVPEVGAIAGFVGRLSIGGLCHAVTPWRVCRERGPIAHGAGRRYRVARRRRVPRPRGAAGCGEGQRGPSTGRADERRGGNEWVGAGRSRGWESIKK